MSEYLFETMVRDRSGLNYKHQQIPDPQRDLNLINTFMPFVDINDLVNNASAALATGEIAPYLEVELDILFSHIFSHGPYPYLAEDIDETYLPLFRWILLSYGGMEVWNSLVHIFWQQNVEATWVRDREMFMNLSDDGANDIHDNLHYWVNILNQNMQFEENCGPVPLAVLGSDSLRNMVIGRKQHGYSNFTLLKEFDMERSPQDLRDIAEEVLGCVHLRMEDHKDPTKEATEAEGNICGDPQRDEDCLPTYGSGGPSCYPKEIFDLQHDPQREGTSSKERNPDVCDLFEDSGPSNRFSPVEEEIEEKIYRLNEAIHDATRLLEILEAKRRGFPDRGSQDRPQRPQSQPGSSWPPQFCQRDEYAQADEYRALQEANIRFRAELDRARARKPQCEYSLFYGRNSTQSDESLASGLATRTQEKTSATDVSPAQIGENRDELDISAEEKKANDEGSGVGPGDKIRPESEKLDDGEESTTSVSTIFSETLADNHQSPRSPPRPLDSYNSSISSEENIMPDGVGSSSSSAIQNSQEGNEAEPNSNKEII